MLIFGKLIQIVAGDFGEKLENLLMNKGTNSKQGPGDLGERREREGRRTDRDKTWITWRRPEPWLTLALQNAQRVC